MKLHHLGIACRDLDEAARALERQGLGAPVGARVWDPLQEAWLQMLQAPDGTRLELVQGPKVEGLAKRGVALYHSCFEVPDLDAALARMAAHGAQVVSEPAAAVLFGGRRVAFVRAEAGLLELLEAERA